MLFALDLDDLSLPARSVEYYSERGRPLTARDQPRTHAARRELIDDEKVWLYGSRTAVAHVGLRLHPRPLPETPDGSSTVLIVQDVSEIHRAALERGAILAAVSHELRDPLQVVLGRRRDPAGAR